ncbi:type II toxin-antitoxin system HicA family toxin [Dyadobacter sp. CY345]|uniref:type II toxin-antitoxin system HicA family toxin n=1 Tax=Dyadobacter sp. CY345 TaxID=2909335 RepID=UPI001F434300|nr:type II toxin-antitoxin system HicA family toxin [Dyadobacter sp. CY345]MCF2442728.1 type II toxin-antitoxin system HicA family toxin [Dyadobacter sp. CY345]
MSKFEKVLLKILSGSSDNNFSYLELRLILLNLGFTERSSGGSHRIFFRNDITEILNIQPNGSKAKPYQVKQVRNIILKYNLSKL